MAETHKKQHYVPGGYLSAWCDPDSPQRTPHVWVYPKDGSTGKAKAPKNIFHETDFYTIQGPDGSRNLTLEKGLSQLERAFCKLRRETFDKRAELTFRGRKVLLAFCASMYARSKFQRDHWKGEFSRFSEWTEGIIDAVTEMSPEERERFIKGMSRLAQPPPDTPSTSLLELHSDARKAAEAPMQHILLDLTASSFMRSWEFDIAIFETNQVLGFITSDNPCIESYVIDREPAHSLRFRFVLPLSPRQALVLNAGGVTGYVEAPPQMVSTQAKVLVNHLNRW